MPRQINELQQQQQKGKEKEKEKENHETYQHYMISPYQITSIYLF